MAPSDPSRVVSILSAYWASAALNAAIEIGLFTALGRGRLSAARLARRCRSDEGRLERLADYLVGLGVLAKDRGAYRSAPDVARFLDDRSADALTGLTGFFNATAVASAFAGLGGIVRKGAPRGTRPRERDALWTGFARQTWALRRTYARHVADELGRRRLVGPRIVDVGAGASPFGIELLCRHGTAHLTVQDRGTVVDVALERARAAGVAARVTPLPGDARTIDIGGPFDLALMVNALDYVEARSRLGLVRKVHGALAPGGVLAVGAPLLDPGRTSPPDASTYDLLLLALGAPARPFTFGELGRLLERAGFARVTRVAPSGLVLARKRRTA
jgi:SAM-dependent methyltransferase